MELYIHIPFCVKKCSYCDFLSMSADSGVKTAYIRKLKDEIAFRAREYENRRISTIFIGGGTPSILHTQHIYELMECITNEFSVRKDAEISIECNPGTLNREKLDIYKRAGINRISLGLQSASDKELARLGRIHNYADFLESFDYARKAGFDNINVDIMSSLPQQTVKSYEQTLKKVAMLKPEHISAYSLIIEEGTQFHKIYGYDDETRKKGGKPLFLPTEDDERRMYQLTQEYLESKGYMRYEISNFARKGKECRHNVGYWKRADYLGLGLGASSMIDNVRFTAEENIAAYLQWDYTKKNVIELSKEDQMSEYMFLGLRMMEGVKKQDFLMEFSVPMDLHFGEAIKKFADEGLLTDENGIVMLTPRGVDVSNYVFSGLLL